MDLPRVNDEHVGLVMEALSHRRAEVNPMRAKTFSNVCAASKDEDVKLTTLALCEYVTKLHSYILMRCSVYDL
ncbi:hypothetical protein RIF29_00645 [Crotalaria pallida]|uniref:Uncharacterized protein n=1 Tax=Crotalaria pallida TaxID=3830 RepID=A0AAN9P751_CROPI